MLQNAIIMIMLDFNNPWNFMLELEKWVKFIYELQKQAGFKITELEEMQKSIEQYFQRFKEPELDEFGKIK